MIPLRQLFLVDKLHDAASSKSNLSLKVIREIIKGIKGIQLDKQLIADDEMVMDVLEDLLEKKHEEIEILRRLIAEATDHKMQNS